MKVISFCLWGNDSKYTIGAIKNSLLAPEVYPGWECFFYCANCVSEDVVRELQKNAKVIRCEKMGDWKFTVERFKAIDTPEVTHVIFRDTDSRLNKRESLAVSEWLSSDKTLHIMKDHPHHGGFPILAGMWGINKKKFNLNMSDMLSFYQNSVQYHYDQIFLRDYVWRFFDTDFIAHDEFFLKSPYPSKRNGTEYVGKPFNADDTPSLPDDERYFT